MALYLVRHAKAGDRRDWSPDDHLRPLSPKGQAQAVALADLLAGSGAVRVLSSPFVRCVQTVEVLAGRLGLKVEEHDALAEGAWAAAAADLAREVAARGPGVLCSHGDVIPSLLYHLQQADGLRLEGDRGMKCAKGSTWALDLGPDDRFVRGVYLPPPA
ncbi:MAG: phosphoglycerate mutase family protein [Actinomycetota bacterium]